MSLLTEIANKYGTDKGTIVQPAHGFSEIYDTILNNNRENVLKVLEIGVDKGLSLRMWRDYFPNAQIHGVDVLRHHLFTEDRIKTHYGNQSNINDLTNLINEIGGDFDLIIDDGGHHTLHQQISLGFLFKYLKSNGVYIVEDLHTSFYPDWMGNWGLTIDYEDSAYNVLKRYEDGNDLRTKHIPETELEYLKSNIKSLKVYDINDDKEHITSIIIKK